MLVQSTLLQPYTLYTGALTYTTTLLEPTNTQPCTSLQTPTQSYKRIIQPLHAYNTYILYTYKTLHTYTTPTYIHYRYNLHYSYNPYNTTHPMIYTAYWPCHCTHAQWACGWPVRLLFASDRILCAATSIGDHIMSEMLPASCRRKKYWIPTKTCNSGRLHNHYLHKYPKNILSVFNILSVLLMPITAFEMLRLPQSWNTYVSVGIASGFTPVYYGNRFVFQNMALFLICFLVSLYDSGDSSTWMLTFIM